MLREPPHEMNLPIIVKTPVLTHSRIYGVANSILVTAVVMLCLAAGLLPSSTFISPTGSALAQQVTQRATLVGTWNLLLVDNILPDGSRIHLYGADPQGILTFDSEGRYALQIYSAARVKFTSGDKSKGTPEENRAALLGSNSHYGTYLVNAVDDTILFRIQHASFPNWDGTDQRRAFTISGDELTYTVPTPTSGGAAVGEVKWRRAQ